MFSITPVHNRKSATNKSGFYTVNIRVTIDRKSIYLKIRHFPKLETKHWDKTRSQVNNLHKDGWKLNEILHKQTDKINSYCLKQLMNDRPLSLDAVRNFYLQKNDKFLDWAKSFVRKKEYSTFQKYMVLLNNIEKACANFSFDKSNLLLLKTYFDKLGHIDNTQAKSFSTLHTLYKEAVKAEIVYNYDQFLFDSFKFKHSKAKRTALTADELQHIFNAKIEDADLSLWRFQFCFLCFSGLYYRDLANLNIARDLRESKKGLYLTNERIKTGNTFIIPLWIFPEQIQIVEKYRSDDGLFPKFLSDQKFNQKIKLVAELCGIKKKLTNKVGRHTFTDMCIARGINRQFVSKMLGHSNESTTQIYYEMNIEHFTKQLE